MKKLFLFTCLSALALSLNGCSGDDDNSSDAVPSGTVSFTIGGVQKTYTTISVNKEDVNDVEEDRLTITASDGSATNLVQFELYEEEVGSNMHYYFEFKINGQDYDTDYDNFSSNIIANNDDTNTIRGTFAGKAGFGDNAITITDGTIDITYAD